VIRRGRVALALAVALGVVWPHTAKASPARDVSFKATPFATAKALPQLQTPAEDALAMAARADECEALCELAASVEEAPFGYVLGRRPPLGRIFLYDDTSLLAEYDTNGNEVAKYDYGGDRLIRLTRSDEGTRYFSFDGLGSVTGLTDTTGAVTAAYHLDAWGNYRFTSDLAPSKNRFGFTGHYWDNEAGLYYAKARFYDPFTARFTQADSFLGNIDDPPSLHRYFYAHGNPTMFVDPSGNVAIIDNLFGGAASVAIGWGVSKITGQDYQWKDAAVDFGLGFATSGLSSLTKLKDAGKVAQWATRAGAETAVDAGAEVARKEWKGEEYTAGDMATGAATNLVIGEAGAAVGRRVGNWWRGRGQNGAPHAEVTEPRTTIAQGPSAGAGNPPRFDAAALSTEQVDRAILRSIRRASGAQGNAAGEIVASADQIDFILQKATSWRRNVHASRPGMAGLPPELKGTRLHSSVQSRVRTLDVRDLIVNERLYGSSPYISPVTGKPYEFRIPDFRLRTTIFDIKPVGTPLGGPQYNDFVRFSGSSDVRWIPYQRY